MPDGDKTIRNNAPDDVKNLIINTEGNGAQNDYASKKEPEKKEDHLRDTAFKTAEQHKNIDAMQGAYKHPEYQESRDSDNPYEDSLMPEYHNQKPLSEVVKKEGEDES